MHLGRKRHFEDFDWCLLCLFCVLYNSRYGRCTSVLTRHNAACLPRADERSNWENVCFLMTSIFHQRHQGRWCKSFMGEPFYTKNPSWIHLYEVVLYKSAFTAAIKCRPLYLTEKNKNYYQKSLEREILTPAFNTSPGAWKMSRQAADLTKPLCSQQFPIDSLIFFFC